MPSGWVHAVMDVIAFGRPYFDLHKAKDSPSAHLGWEHRSERHSWYNQLGTLWTKDEPFGSAARVMSQILMDLGKPDVAEEVAAYVAHDWLDRQWDELSPSDRKDFEGFCAWLILNPKGLKEWAGVDVEAGEVLVERSEQVWESCPALTSEYRRLARYVRAVINNDGDLRRLVETGGASPSV